jgi:hypothetical protein
MHICLNCERNEEQIPLISLRFNGEQLYICPQCLPVLIHKPEKMSKKLPGIDSSTSVEHDD